MTKKELIMKLIEGMGYTAVLDEDGDVVVVFQMKTIYFMTSDDEDEHGFSVLFPNVASLNEGEGILNLSACDAVNRRLRFVKMFIDNEHGCVVANCDFFYTDDACLKMNVEYALHVLAITRSMYTNVLDELKCG